MVLLNEIISMHWQALSRRFDTLISQNQIGFDLMEQTEDTGRHQNTRRMAEVLDSIALAAPEGARLVDICRATGLGKGTGHRIVAGLVEAGLALQDHGTSRFFIGPRVTSWAQAVQPLDIVRQAGPILDEICDLCGDTVYLAVRQGDEAVYVARRVGSYPLKALPVEVGARRPLGIGAAPIAILAFSSPQDIERVVAAHSSERKRFGIGDEQVLEFVARAQALKYSLHLGEVMPGLIAIGIPITDAGGNPVAAISVAAVRDRLQGERQNEVAKLISAALARYPMMT